jgi:hypothetical protein
MRSQGADIDEAEAIADAKAYRQWLRRQGRGIWTRMEAVAASRLPAIAGINYEEFR